MSKKPKNKQNSLTKFIKFLVELYEIQDYKKMPYYKYLQTEHWRVLREHKLLTVDNRCQLCYNEWNLQVHHRTYERLGNEKLEDLTVLCKECHELFHKNGRMPKR